MRPWEVKNGGALSAYLSGLTPRAIRFRPNPGLSTILDCLRATIHRDSRRLSGDCSEKDSGPARGSTGKPTITRATAPDDAMLRTYCAYCARPRRVQMMRSMDCAVCSRRRAHGRTNLKHSSRGRRARERAPDENARRCALGKAGRRSAPRLITRRSRSPPVDRSLGEGFSSPLRIGPGPAPAPGSSACRRARSCDFGDRSARNGVRFSNSARFRATVNHRFEAAVGRTGARLGARGRP